MRQTGCKKTIISATDRGALESFHLDDAGGDVLAEFCHNGFSRLDIFIDLQKQCHEAKVPGSCISEHALGLQRLRFVAWQLAERPYHGR